MNSNLDFILVLIACLYLQKISNSRIKALSLKDLRSLEDIRNYKNSNDFCQNNRKLLERVEEVMTYNRESFTNDFVYRLLIYSDFIYNDFDIRSKYYLKSNL